VTSPISKCEFHKADGGQVGEHAYTVAHGFTFSDRASAAITNDARLPCVAARYCDEVQSCYSSTGPRSLTQTPVVPSPSNTLRLAN